MKILRYLAVGLKSLCLIGEENPISICHVYILFSFDADEIYSRSVWTDDSGHVALCATKFREDHKKSCRFHGNKIHVLGNIG